MPDPTAPATYHAAKLDWSEPNRAPHADRLSWYQSILAVRHDRIMPILPSIAGGAGSYECFGDGGLAVAWQAGDRLLQVRANLSERPVEVPSSQGEVIWREGSSDGIELGAWSVVWALV